MSADGQSLETVVGGVRATDWHFMLAAAAALAEFLGLPTHEYASGGSPAGHPAGIEYYYALLDGGLAYHDFWRMRNGKQVIGYSCVRYFCYALGLKQPRKLRGENEIPTHESLQQEIKVQQSDMAVGVGLELSIDRFRERFRM